MEFVEIRAHSAPWNDCIELLILQRLYPADERKYAVAKPIVMETVPVGNYIADPSLRISRTAAQQLMDNLWQCGLRPSEGSGSAGSLKATERHLDDMRRLVFKASSSGDKHE